MSLSTKITLIYFTALLLLSASQAMAAGNTKNPPPTAATASAVKSRIDNLSRLVNISSGAQRVTLSNNPKAIALKEHAAQMLEKGISEFRSGNYEKANRTLGAATRDMFSAIRLVGIGQSERKKRMDDFQARVDSVEALLTALKRIGQEKGAGQRVTAVIASARSQIGKAQKLMSDGQGDQGRKLLDTAYESAKVGIERLRSGDTLVRSLNFKNKEEEYHYELDRNSTHRMLVTVLLEEKMKQPRVKKQVDSYLLQARKLRAKAEQEAQNGAFGPAVETLERATKELVRAIRSAGVYIPG